MSTAPATVTLTEHTPAEILAGLAGARVAIPGRFTGRLIGAPWHMRACPGIGADMIHDAHGDCRGGHTSTHLPYGTTVTVLDGTP